MVSLQSPHRTTQRKPKECCRWMKLVLHVMNNLGWWFRVQPPSEMIAQFNPTSSGNSKFDIGSIPWNNMKQPFQHWVPCAMVARLEGFPHACLGPTLQRFEQFLPVPATWCWDDLIKAKLPYLAPLYRLRTEILLKRAGRISKVWNKNRYLINYWSIYIDLNYLAQNHSTLLQILWLVHLQSVSHIFWSNEMSTLSVRFAIFANGKHTNFQFAKQLPHWWFHLCKKPEASQVRNKAAKK